MNFLFHKKKDSEYTHKDIAINIKYIEVFINLFIILTWFVLHHLYVHILTTLDVRQIECIEAKSTHEISIISLSEDKIVWVSATDLEIKNFCEKRAYDIYWENYQISFPLTLMLVLTIKYSIFKFSFDMIKSKLNEKAVSIKHLGHILQTKEKDK
ncbi:MAG: hypothetical protein H7196_03660 [candidate division SR1 bacterium]|nr:hypothetical protein [candidate division SR1 bacterium]